MRFFCRLLSLIGAAAASEPKLGGGLWPRVNPDTWPVWSPPTDFATTFSSWKDELASDSLLWCQAFIPTKNTSGVRWVNGTAVVPLTLPLGIPLPGLSGQCAAIDGRDWAPEQAYEIERPAHARFGGFVKVSAKGVESQAKCGYSHNYCCRASGCGAGVGYGDVTCKDHCADDLMQVRRVRCWTDTSGWIGDGVDCEHANGTILAVKAYIYGRGGDPCVHPLGVPAPAATWDIGMVMFPTKRRALVRGYVDDAPATECYARFTDAATKVASTAALAQLAMPSGDVPSKLVGYSDRPLNEHDIITHVPLAVATASAQDILV